MKSTTKRTQKIIQSLFKLVDHYNISSAIYEMKLLKST